MSFFDSVKKLAGVEPKPEADFWKRNVGKKIPAKILMPTEDEIKQQENEH